MIPSYRMPKDLRIRRRYLGKGLKSLKDSEVLDIHKGISLLQSENPTVSIVIIAFNEELNILSTLDSLSALRPKVPIEIIVVDNNSTDLTAETIRRSGAKYVFEARQGYAAARQAGLLHAKGKFVISGDADTLYPPHWVEAMTEPFKDTNVVCTSGLYAFYTDKGDHPWSLRFYQIAKHISLILKVIQRPHLVCMGGTMAYRREKAMEVGGYDLNVVRGSDGTLAWELGRLGKIKIVISRRGMVWTSMRRTLKEGSLWKAFVYRFQKDMKPFFEYFFPQKKRTY